MSSEDNKKDPKDCLRIKLKNWQFDIENIGELFVKDVQITFRYYTAFKELLPEIITFDPPLLNEITRSHLKNSLINFTDGKT